MLTLCPKGLYVRISILSAQPSTLEILEPLGPGFRVQMFWFSLAWRLIFGFEGSGLRVCFRA